MASSFLFITIFFMFLVNFISCHDQGKLELGTVQLVRSRMLRAMEWANGGVYQEKMRSTIDDQPLDNDNSPLSDCLKLYEASEPRLERIISGDDYSLDDAVAWLSGVSTSHRSCLDGLEKKRVLLEFQDAHNLTFLLEDALASLRKQSNRSSLHKRNPTIPLIQKTVMNKGLLVSWNATSKADIVVAQDGSGNYRTIMAAIASLNGINGKPRTIIYVKSGVYHENVEIGKKLKNLMFVGDGIDKTIVSASKNVQDGSSLFTCATFAVVGDGFWARDMTFENTAGPNKHQAVALRAASDLSVFYRCSFKGYQDTLFVHSMRQFYRNCQIYGTVDFIFGNAAVVFQDCDIIVRKPMDQQSNMITAQGRDSPHESTGISIIECRVTPSSEFKSVDGRIQSYLGRPWKRYSRTVFMKTNLDGFVNPRGWQKWSGNFALSTLYYAEYMNYGNGASLQNRVKWPGFHVLNSPSEASAFSVAAFIQGSYWIPASGVPFTSYV